MESTGLLADSCVPVYWPRDFSTRKPAIQYTGYVLQNKPGQLIQGMHQYIRLGSDSSYNLLIDYASTAELKGITIENVRPLSNERVKVGLIDGLKENLTDDELVYIKVSPVVADEQLSKGVFYYELYGEDYESWVVCVRRKDNHWTIISKERLAIS